MRNNKQEKTSVIALPLNDIASKVEEKPSHQAYFKKAFQLAKDYFLHSDERLIAWLLLLGAVVCVFGFVAMMAVLSWWTAGFWAALAAKSLPLFMASMETFVYTISGLVTVSVLKNYLVEYLGIRWRNWLTQKSLKNYIFGENKYLDLMRHSDQIDNPEQRIQEDVKSFVDLSLSLMLELLRSTVSLATFIGTLWVVGGPLSLVLWGASITIPGYLVWMAVLCAVIASYITQKIGSSLAKYNHKQEKLEADFRKEMETMKNEADSIALERGESYYQSSLLHKFKDLCSNALEKIRVKTKLVAFQSFYLNLSSILPYLVSAPLYFSGMLDIAQLMQIGFAFGEVSDSLNWFVNTFETLATYKTNIERIIELEKAFEAGGLKSTEKGIIVKVDDLREEWNINHVKIACPSSTKLIMRDLNITFRSGENTVIEGTSGLGKSTLFKVMDGTWKYGHGEVIAPRHHNVYFLPQRPIIPEGSLKAVLAFPAPSDTFTDEQYIAVLRVIGGDMDEFIEELDKKDMWSKRLSGGQQQRISFARALLKKPDWLFLDEATASLEETGERRLYNLLKDQLKTTTFISIAHRHSVHQFHDRVITFEKNDSEGDIHYTEHWIGERSRNDLNDGSSSLMAAY